MRLGGWLKRLRKDTGADVAPAGVAHPAVDDMQQDAEAVLRAGLEQQARGEHAQAQAAYEQALALKHDFSPAHLALGRLQLDLDRLEDAIDSLQLAALFDAHSAEARAELGCALAHSGDEDAARANVDQAIALAGRNSAVWMQCGRACKTLHDYPRAAQCFETALEIEPSNADCACQLGYVRYLHGAYENARAAFHRALAISPSHVATLHDLGLLELETGDAQCALDLFERAHALRPSPESHACIGHALRDLGRLEQACAVYEAVLAEHPGFGDARINYAYALLMRGALDAGWAQYEARFEATATPARDFGLPRWRGELLAGRRLLVYAEQGLGDEIMFASCVPDVLKRASGCVLECNARLAPLFARSFPGVLVRGGRKSDAPDWVREVPTCDYQVAIGDLPRYLRSTEASFEGRGGYLTADASRVEHWRRRLPTGRVNVGIAWHGGTLRGRQWLRSIPLEHWAGLLATDGFGFIALQYGEHSAEIAQVRTSHAVALEDHSAVCADIDELAALVGALDLIVTVDNTLAHLAGALGRPVWVLLPAAPEWRYPRAGARMPWYPSMRLFRQSVPADTAALMTAVRDALQTEWIYDDKR